jgi:Uncharacterized protein conserved in bacteria (DUF2330)
MRYRAISWAMAGALALLPALLASNDARACGGCFHVESEGHSTVVTGHRMAFALSPTHTVLWDQIQYAGDPGSFAWVLPVKPGARIELSTDAWFESLDAATTAQVVNPRFDCPGAASSGCTIGCAATALSDGGEGFLPAPPVTVVHRGTVGPYETVTLHSSVPGALATWLTSNKYAIDPTVQPIVDAYTKEGFDFIALRLLPDQGVQQMKPVRVVSPGMSPTLPLRMVAAGTGANVDITLFVIGEGTWTPQNFPSGQVDEGSLIWDFINSSSNYAEQRKALLAGADGRTWNEAYSIKGALLSPRSSPDGFSNIVYQVGEQSPDTIAGAYVAQGIKNGESQDDSCLAAFQSYGASLDMVVDVCGASSGSGGSSSSSSGSGAGGNSTSSGSGAGGNGGSGGAQPTCSSAGPGQIDARVFACGPLDDLAVALQGLHPQDVTLTRLEASLPRAALATDLVLQASDTQKDVSNWFQVTLFRNTPSCEQAMMPVVGGDSGKGPWNRNRWALFATVLAFLLATFGRRAARPSLALSRSAR